MLSSIKERNHMSKKIYKTDQGTYAVNLFLKEDEYNTLQHLCGLLKMNEYDSIKHSVQLVDWWASGKIEPEE